MAGGPPLRGPSAITPLSTKERNNVPIKSSDFDENATQVSPSGDDMALFHEIVRATRGVPEYEVSKAIDKVAGLVAGRGAKSQARKATASKDRVEKGGKDRSQE